MASEGFFSQPGDVVETTARQLHEVEDDKEELLYCDYLDDLGRASLFAQIMWKLWSVMDHCHYALYHKIQNEREHSHWQAGQNVKTPHAEKLKWSADGMRDEQSECSLTRKTFVTKHTKTIFGEHYQSNKRITDSYLKEFQENALSLQAVIEVDKAGVPVKICQQHSVQQCNCSNKVSSLVRAQKYEYMKTPDDQRGFNPSRIHFENLESVRMPVIDWSETTLFNLLHCFRNYTTHRCLISLHRKVCPHGETLWISVPEITDIRDEKSIQSYHKHRLSLVLGRLFYFVRDQRQKLLSMEEDDEFAHGEFIFLALSLIPNPCDHYI